mmetsp:Transcript_43224/g.101486  ORF Transcript_43224/g.101486 Transcript_43224/m.101486 type:complete len:156 (+) Transcript_43224:195-662(+)
MWDANRRVKSNQLVVALDIEEMRCGLGATQLLALREYAATIGGGSRRGRNQKSIKERVHGWLLNTPRKGHAPTGFCSLCDSEDGATLWRFFEQHEADARPEGLLILVRELRDTEAAARWRHRPNGAAEPDARAVLAGRLRLGLRAAGDLTAVCCV